MFVICCFKVPGFKKEIASYRKINLHFLDCLCFVYAFAHMVHNSMLLALFDCSAESFLISLSPLKPRRHISPVFVTVISMASTAGNAFSRQGVHHGGGLSRRSNGGDIQGGPLGQVSCLLKSEVNLSCLPCSRSSQFTSAPLTLRRFSSLTPLPSHLTEEHAGGPENFPLFRVSWRETIVHEYPVPR